MLDRDAVAAVDSTGQAADILALSDHLLDALWRVEAAALQPAGTAGGLVVAGMGGSGVGGALARALLAPQLERPLELVRGSGVPAYAGPDTLVLCSSYSGNTEETLDAYDAAGAAGAPRVVSTSGGELAVRARRDKVPVSRSPAASSPAPRSATRSSSRSRSRPSPAARRRCARRSRRPRRSRASSRTSGDPTGRRTATRSASRGRCTRACR